MLRVLQRETVIYPPHTHAHTYTQDGRFDTMSRITWIHTRLLASGGWNNPHPSTIVLSSASEWPRPNPLQWEIGCLRDCTLQLFFLNLWFQSHKEAEKWWHIVFRKSLCSYIFLLTNMFQYSMQGRNMNENYKPCWKWFPLTSRKAWILFILFLNTAMYFVWKEFSFLSDALMSSSKTDILLLRYHNDFLGRY